jgi:hypothetical protein
MTQEVFAQAVGVGDRSTVGKWEMEDGDEPSWPFIGRALVLLGVIDPSGKHLRVPAGGNVDSDPMTTIEERVLVELRKLPDDKRVDVLLHITREAAKHEHSSQPPAALRKG